MTMIVAIPAIFVACFLAWLITRRTGPLTWWPLAGGLQCLSYFLWTGVLIGQAGLNDNIAPPLASGAGLVLVVLMSACLRFLRRNERPHDDPRSQVVLRALRRRVVVVSIIGGTLIVLRIARETNRPRLPPVDTIMPAREDPHPALLQLAQPARSEPPSRAEMQHSLMRSFVGALREGFRGLEAGALSEEVLPFADHIRVELSAAGRSQLVGWVDLYLTDKGGLFLTVLADPASFRDSRSAFRRAIARIEARLPRNVDRAPADYIVLDRSWTRDTASMSPVDSLKLVRRAGRPPHLRFGMVIATYLERAKLSAAAEGGER